MAYSRRVYFVVDYKIHTSNLQSYTIKYDERHPLPSIERS